MSYIPFEMTERLKKTKEIYMGLTVPMMTDPYHPVKYRGHGTGDRLMTLGYLRGWAAHTKANSVLLRASYAEAEALYQSKPMIYDHELLLGHLYLPDYTDEEWAEYEHLAEHYELSAHTFKERPPRKDHVTLDFEKLLRVGINGLRREINEKLSSLELTAAGIYPEMETLKKYEFYQCLLIELDAVSDLAKRYSDEALRLSQSSPEPRKSELVRLSEILKRVPDEPEESFYEALQSVQFFLSTLFGLYPLGRPDRYLYPYYKKDVENGALKKEFAQELIDNFCLYVSDRVFSRAAYDARLAGVCYSDGCGAAQGRDVCGPTAMILSLTSYDQSRLLGGMVVNVKFSKSAMDGEKKQNLVAMVRTFMERGGVEMQINTVDRATLEDARVNPEAHCDLIVRIGGYSDYFIRLAPVLQQEIIDRTEY